MWQAAVNRSALLPRSLVRRYMGHLNKIKNHQNYIP